MGIKLSLFRLLLSLMVLSSFAEESDLTDLRNAILEQTSHQKATYGVAFQLLSGDVSLWVNAHDQMHAASTMKVPVMMRLFEMIDEGKLELSTLIKVQNQFRSIIDGATFSISADSEEYLYGMIGQDVALEKLIVAMITQSSNLATNLLIQLARSYPKRFLSFGVL